MKTLILAGMFFLSSWALAGEDGAYRSLGFSQNGKYYAFAETATLDGSGFAWAQVSVVDVDKNKLLQRKSDKSSEQNQSESEEQVLERVIQQAELSKYGITPNKYLGYTLIDRKDSDTSEYASTSFCAYGRRGQCFGTEYFLVLTAEEVGNGDQCHGGKSGERLKLIMNGSDKTSQDLQEDGRLPEIRACAYGYSIRKVIVRNSKLVVVLSHFKPGFEDPSSYHNIVTADITAD